MNRETAHSPFGQLRRRFLDYFFALAIAVYIGGILLSGIGTYSLIGAAIVLISVAAWAWWRRNNSAISTAFFLVPALILFLTSSSGTSLLILWLTVVMVHFAFGKGAVRVLVAAIVITVAGIHAALGASLSSIFFEASYALLLGFTGVALAHVLQRGLEIEHDRMKLIEKLQDALRDSRELVIARERERVAASLHDGLGHRLTSIGLSLDYSARMIPTDPEKAALELQRARETTTDALNSMRSTVRAMKPIKLIDDNLATTLTQIASSFEGTDLNVELIVDKPVETNDALSNMVIRFVQEALTNVVRHAGADRVTIEFQGETISVADNGTGSDASPDFGITSLMERAAALNAKVTTATHGGIDGGFLISLTLPRQQ
ncbi:sensor histidine kinase [Corynebacterium breve]|uniref:histidine kinase n=1 Tax=Corynebacterium breve TaxID=3049799 RepID=A0ABY8VGH2_9CORY|nr:sensor histidine kinase [Corynebacterium breve]WIM68412.1 sensor histidine kinase [Corynebacterium breve]